MFEISFETIMSRLFNGERVVLMSKISNKDMCTVLKMYARADKSVYLAVTDNGCGFAYIDYAPLKKVLVNHFKENYNQDIDSILYNVS